MNCFIAISEDPQVQAAVPKKFPKHNYPIQPGVYALAAADSTVGDICRMLGIHARGEGGERAAGVVVQVADYNGYFDKGLWEKLQLWEEL